MHMSLTLALEQTHFHSAMYLREMNEKNSSHKRFASFFILVLAEFHAYLSIRGLLQSQNAVVDIIYFSERIPFGVESAKQENELREMGKLKTFYQD